MTDLENNEEPAAAAVVRLGTTLDALADGPDSQDSLAVFAAMANLEHDTTRPHLMTALLQPDGAAQILTVGHARPGLTIQIDADLRLSVPQLWYSEPGQWQGAPSQHGRI